MADAETRECLKTTEHGEQTTTAVESPEVPLQEEPARAPPSGTTSAESTAKLPWVLFPADPTDESVNKDIEELLKYLTGEEPIRHTHDDVLDFWAIDMTKAQSVEAAGYPGILTVEEDPTVEYPREPRGS